MAKGKNAWLRRINSSSVRRLELDAMEVEVLLVVDDDAARLEDPSEEEKEAEAKRLRLLKWIVPKTGAERERLDRAEVASSQDDLRRHAPATAAAGVLALGPRWQELQSFLRAQSRKTSAPDLLEVIAGGRDVGNDMGNGFAKLLRPDAVLKIATALESVERPPDGLAGLMLRVLSFYRASADDGAGILFFIL